MNEHFNNLSPAQAERLAILAEEAGEVIQIVGKILRHGYESHHPAGPCQTNRYLLANEIRDFIWAITLMMDRNDIPEISGHEVESITAGKMPWTHHQEI